MEDVIISRTGCSSQEAARAAAKLKTLSPELVPHLKAWLKDESYTFSKDYGGYSLKNLMDDFGMTFTGAILTLDWLIREPEKAREALAYGIR